MAPHTAERKSQLASLLSATPRNFSRTVGGAGGGPGVFGGAASQLRYPAMPEAATPMSAAPADRGFAGFFGLCTPPAKDRESRGVSTAETPTLDSRLSVATRAVAEQRQQLAACKHCLPPALTPRTKESLAGPQADFAPPTASASASPAGCRRVSLAAGQSRATRRRSSVSKLIKESYDDDSKDIKVRGAQLETRLQLLNPEEDPEEVELRERANRHVIDHESLRYYAWSALMTFLAFYSNFVVGYQVAFFSYYNAFDATLVVEYLIDLVFVLDLYSGFFVSYFEEDVKVMQRHQIVHQFLRSPRFWMDAMACLPLDLIQAAIGWNPLTRVNKLFRLYSHGHQRSPINVRARSATATANCRPAPLLC